MENTKRIRCVYSIGVPFGYHGTGMIAYYAARGIYNAGMLKRLICLSHKRTQIPENLIKDAIPAGRIVCGAIEKLAILLGSANGYGAKDTIYDKLACLHMVDCDIFHGWSLESLESLDSAKQKGAKFTILERSSSHILKQKSILESEYEKYHIERPPIDRIEVERNIAAYEKADYIIVPSEFAYESFIELGFNKNKLVLIPYGYDPQLFKPAARQNNVFRVLFCGSITLRKGVAYLLEAWDRLKFKNAELILIGRVFKDAETILKGCAGKNPSIKIKGFVPHNETTGYYQNADVFLFPSLEEGSALVVYEAMAHGLPIITTFNSGSVVRDGIDGFIIKPQDTDSLCDKLQLLYDNRDKRQQMGANASGHIKNYTWDKYSERLCGFYNSLIKQ